MKINNICLNLLDNYYMFYDWLKDDEIDKDTTVIAHKVSSKVISDLISYKIKIINLDLISNGLIHLFTDDFSYVVIEFDKNGNSLYKSSLLLKDEIKVSKKTENLKRELIQYKKISEDIPRNDLRINEKIRNIIRIELNNLQKEVNSDKLEYLYYEWFKKVETSPQKMLHNMDKKLSMPLTQNELYIYDLIKKSYKLV